MSPSFFAEPKIAEECDKDLTTPLNSCISFLEKILGVVITNTNIHLENNQKKPTDFQELLDIG